MVAVYVYVVWIAAINVVTAWLWAAMLIDATRRILRSGPPPGLLWVFHELRPFYLSAVTVLAVGKALVGMDVWGVIIIGGMYAAWWFFKDIGGDDDRWKRRRRRAAVRVARVGSRLRPVVVVPATG